MTEQDTAPEGATVDGETAATHEEQRTDLATLPQDVREYIESLRSEAKKYRLEKKQVETAAQQQQREKLAADEKWQELAETYKARLAELEPLAEQLEATRSAIAEGVQRRIDALPKQWRGAVPQYDDPTKTAAWLDTNAALFTAPAVPNTGAGEQGDRKPEGVKLTPEAKHAAELAKNYGFSLKPEAIAARQREIIEQRRQAPEKDE